MNTNQMSELVTLHTLVNDPLNYEAKEAPKDPLAWLLRGLEWVGTRMRRFGQTQTGSIEMVADAAS